jgi:peptidoglycan hydrolase-like protein with peptidoglycan-binding domain
MLRSVSFNYEELKAREFCLVFKRGRTTIAVIAVTAGVAAIAGGAVVLLPHGHAKAAEGASTAHTVSVLHVLAAAPAAGTQDVNGAAPIRLTLAGDVSPSAPLPHLSPAIPGSWQRTGTTLVFTPATGFQPHTHVTVSVPGQAWTTSYTTGTYSLLRLQQLLAQLGFLPLSWAPDAVTPASDAAAAAAPHSTASAPAAAAASPGTAAAGKATDTRSTTPAAPAAIAPGDASAQLSAAYQPPAGSFSWHDGYPSELSSFWEPGQMNLVTTGAIMAFESQHGMDMDGLATPAVWTAVLHAVAAQETNPDGYSYAIASKAQPETLTIWHDGRKVFRSYANTGIPIDPTADGTFPVYLRYRFQVMQGTNPDGSHYADPVEFVSYFHEGEAVHYFPRYSYGWPQSLGCVELPYTSAEEAWPYMTYGTLVTVTP